MRVIHIVQTRNTFSTNKKEHVYTLQHAAATRVKDKGVFWSFSRLPQDVARRERVMNLCSCARERAINCFSFYVHTYVVYERGEVLWRL